MDDADVFSSDRDTRGNTTAIEPSAAIKRRGKGLFEDAEGKEKAKPSGKVTKTPGKSLKASASSGSLGAGEIVVTTEENSLQLSNKEV